MEWIDPSALGTSGVLPAADGTDYFIGAYDSADGVFLNPLSGGVTSDTTWTITDSVWAFTDRDPSLRPSGSIGNAIFYTQSAGIYKETQTTEVDSMVLVRYWEEKKAEFDAYNKQKETFNKAKTAV